MEKTITKIQHTPGPWVPVIFHPQNRYEIYSESGSRTCIAKINFNTALTKNAEHEANVKLIAAAPDMLYALREALKYENMPLITYQVELIEAAIKKATT